MSFKVARAKSQSIPRVQERALAAGSAFKAGALLLVNANNEYAECGADPVAIAAVALTGAGASTEIGNRLGKEEFPPGFMQATAVQDEVVFRAKYVGALPAAVGGSYGVIKDADGFWKVDFNETVATRLKYIRSFALSPENLPEVAVVFLAANVQVI
jgi:hypothetical protein